MSDSLPRLIATWPSLVERRNRLLWVETLGHGGLFERQLLGRPVERLELGPPGRPEFRDVQAVPQEVLNLSSQGYLGLSCDPRVMAAAVKAIETFGTHAGGPRLLSGTTSSTNGSRRYSTQRASPHTRAGTLRTYRPSQRFSAPRTW